MEARRLAHLQTLFDPRAVAIVGASDNPAKWGNWIAQRALNGEHRRSVFFVNHARGRVLGRETYRTVQEVGQPVDLVVVAVPAAAFEAAVDDALAAGARAIVGISAGLGERGEEGQAQERALVERVRAAGAVLLGPNCLGVLDSGAALDLTSNGLPPGPIGLISQSGNLALELAMLAEDANLGFSRFASLGNQADVTLAELITCYSEHPGTELIAIYCEDFKNGREVVAAARGAITSGKPVLLITVSASGAAGRAARSHTGALVSDSLAITAACRAAGIRRVFSPRELIDAAAALLAKKPLRGRRVAVVADGGGHGVLAAATLHEHGFDVPELSPATVRHLSEALPPTASTKNPIDFAGGGEQDITSFARVADVLAHSREVDAILMTGYFGGYGLYSDDLRERETAVADALGALAVKAEIPLLVHTMHAASPAAAVLRAHRVPVYRYIESAVGALGACWEAPPRESLQDMPAPAAPISEPDYWEARQILQEAGIPFPRAERVTSAEQARAAAERVGFPVVVKALGLNHKSDQGGVVLGLKTGDDVARAVRDLAARLGVRAFTVEAMVPLEAGFELIVGTRWDARFGPIAVVGFGGIYAEVLDTVAVALAPLTAGQAVDLLRSMKGARLLTGYRGRAGVALDQVGDIVARLSRVAAEHPEIGEIEMNPVFAGLDRAVALDARVVTRTG